MTRRWLAALLVASISSAAHSQSSNNPFRDYIFCVLQTSIDFSKTEEPAEVVAKAAQTKCAPMKDAAVNRSVAGLKKSGPTPHPVADAELRKLAEEYITQRVNDEALLKVIETRAKK